MPTFDASTLMPHPAYGTAFNSQGLLNWGQMGADAVSTGAGAAGGMTGGISLGPLTFNPIMAVFTFLANKWDIFGLNPDMPSFDELPPEDQAAVLDQGYRDMMREQGVNVDGQQDTEGVMQFSPEMMMDAYNNIKDTVGEYGLGTMGEIVDALNNTGLDNELLSPQQDLIDMGLDSNSDMFYDAVAQAEATKVDLTQEQLKDIQQRVYVNGENAVEVLDEYGIFVDADTFDLKTGMDAGGDILNRVNILEAGDGGGGGGGGGATDGAGGSDGGAGGGGTGGEGSVGSDAQVGDWVYNEQDGMFHQVGGIERFIPVEGTYTGGQILTNDTAGDVFGEWGTTTDGVGLGEGGGVSGDVDNGGEWVFQNGVFVNSQTGIVRQPDYSVFDSSKFVEGNSYSIGPNGELIDLGDGNGDDTGDDNTGDDGVGDDGTGDDGTGDDGVGDGDNGDGTGNDGVGNGNNGTGNGNGGNGWQADAFGGLFQQAMLDAARTGLYMNVPGNLGSQWRRG